MKPLDIVKTPYGGMGVVTEVDRKNEASITYFNGMNVGNEKSAWWTEGGPDGLTVVDSIPRLLTNCMSHPFGSDCDPGDRHFPISKTE